MGEKVWKICMENNYLIRYWLYCSYFRQAFQEKVKC